MVRLISRQRGGLAATKLTKLFGIDDFPAAKDSGKVLIIIIYCCLIIIIIIIIIIALMNQTMFLKFMLFNQDMFRMNHHPSSVVQNKMKLCNK